MGWDGTMHNSSVEEHVAERKWCRMTGLAIRCGVASVDQKRKPRIADKSDECWRVELPFECGVPPLAW